MNDKDDEINCICTICMENYSDKRKALIFNCGHSICEECYTKINTNKKKCPNCQKDFNNNPVVNFQLMEIISVIEKFKTSSQNNSAPKDCLKSHDESEFYCLDCFTFNCINCISTHLEKDHRLNKVKPKIIQNLSNCKKFYNDVLVNKFIVNINNQKQKFLIEFDNHTLKKIKEEKKSIETIYEKAIESLEQEKAKAIKSLDLMEKNFEKLKKEIEDFDKHIFQMISKISPFIHLLGKDKCEIKEKIMLLEFINEDKHSKMHFKNDLEYFTDEDFEPFKFNSEHKGMACNIINENLSQSFKKVLNITRSLDFGLSNDFKNSFSIKTKNYEKTNFAVNINSELNHGLKQIYLNLENLFK